MDTDSIIINRRFTGIIRKKKFQKNRIESAYLVTVGEIIAR